MDLDALIAKLEQVAAETRDALSTASTHLRTWPSDGELDWKPVAFYIPTPNGPLTIQAFAASERDAANAAALAVELYLRA